MLETIREFAYEQLVASGELSLAERAHAAYLVALAERAEPALAGPEQGSWLERLDLERDNVRCATSRAANRGDVETVVRLGAALIRYWRSHADEQGVRERVAGILSLAATAPPTLTTVKALAGAGDLARSLGEYETAQALFERCLAVARDVGDREGIASALWGLCKFSGHRGRYVAAREYGEESVALYEEIGDRVGLASALCDLGMILYFERRQTAARATLERAIEIARQLGDRDRVSEIVYSLALTYHVAGDFKTARRHYDECLAICRELGSRTIAGSALGNLGNLLTLDGDLEGARQLLHESLTVSRGAGDRRRLAFTLSAVAGLAAASGAFERALQLDAAASAATATMGAKLAPAMREIHDAQL
jgi:tetratricopeptide (TPR) repeat protein